MIWLAFSYAVTGQKNLGGAKMIHGTWNASGVTTGTITWGGTQGDTASGPPQTIVGATAVSSTSVATMTACKVTAIGTLVLTCVSGDQGYWSVFTL